MGWANIMKQKLYEITEANEIIKSSAKFLIESDAISEEQLANIAKEYLQLSDEELKAKLDELDKIYKKYKIDIKVDVLMKLIQDLKKQNKVKSESKKPINESITMLAIGTALALPKIIEIIGKAGNKLIKVYKSMFDKEFKGKKLSEIPDNERAEKLVHFGHELHKKYLKGLEFILKPFIKDEKARKTVASVIFALVVLYFGIHGGLEIANMAPQIGKSIAETLTLTQEIINTVVKTVETSDNFGKAITMILPTLLMKAAVPKEMATAFAKA